ncbi:MAG: ATP-binding protein, partial [Prevotellaceae bacterium]|nr:ATP-binding protein [Candidatus Colivivens equi]
VLCGPNGSGKSTIVRWIYYLVNLIHNYDIYESSEYVNELKDILLGLIRLRIPTYSSTTYLEDSISRIVRLNPQSENYMDEVRSEFTNAITLFSEDLVSYLPKIGERKVSRVLNFIQEILGNEEILLMHSIGTDYYRELFSDCENKLYESYRKNIEIHPIENLKKYIIQHFEEYDPFPTRIQIAEDDVKLLSKESFDNLLGLHRAIYIDTPMSVVTMASKMNNAHWYYLQNLLIQKNKNHIYTMADKKIQRRIHSILHGTVETRKETQSRAKLHFVRDDGLDIEVSKIATGMKSFVYLLQLLSNGWLDKNTLLIIDEPEAHEHPQWIVDFARLLVLLNKELGVKFLLASHNPDMVSAIQSIAKREGIIDDLTFYQASLEDGSLYKYRFENQGTELMNIFKSFNIALDRIRDYGERV